MIIDLALGAIVFAGFMLAWWRERSREVVGVLVIDDEVLHNWVSSMKRFEASAQSLGVANRKAAEAFEKFGKAFAESMERERQAGRW